MAAPVTREALEGYLRCRYKGYLKQTGQDGTASDYEAVLAEQRDAVRRAAVERIAARHAEGEVVRDLPLTAQALSRGPAFVLDATAEDEHFSVRFDGLMRVDGPSKLGPFHYVPVLFHGGGSVRKEQRLLLEVCGLLLSRFQGRAPGHGVVWHGDACRAAKVRLGTDPRKAQRLLRDAQQLGAEPPPLVLNDHCQECEFRRRCHDRAVREDNLSLLRGLGEKEVSGYARKGILTLTQLAHTFRPRRKGKRTARPTPHRYHALQALAVRDRRVYLVGTPEFPDAPARIYLDIEGLPDEGFVYLIGMTVVRGGAEERHSFWADTKDQERQILERFLAEVGKYADARVYCYGSYERAFLKRMRKAVRRKGVVDRVLAGLVNVLSTVYAHAYFPCHSNGLKDVAGCLGYSWSDPQASGIQSIVWRKRWNADQTEDWKLKLITYNQEDCAALRTVTEFLESARAGVADAGGTTPPTEGRPAVAAVEEVDRWDNNRKWGRVNFVQPEFEQINECAYFDYQRDRVFIRTSRTIRKSRQAKKRGRQRLRATRRVRVTTRKCPKCGGTSLTTEVAGGTATCPVPRVKRALDLRVTPAGIRRQVIECRTSVHRCRDCGHDFIPSSYERLDKHYHALKSWAMYQHVAHRISFETIGGMIEEFFGLRLHATEIYMFKSLMARYYLDCNLFYPSGRPRRGGNLPVALYQ